MITPTLYQILEIGSGQLFTMAKPIGKWIDEEIYALKNMGIQCVVSLLTKEEEEELNLQTENVICRNYNIEFLSYPILDRGIPSSKKDVSQIVTQIYNIIYYGKKTAIHCRAGIGRASLIAALVMIHDGITTKKAFEIISMSRGVNVPDTDEQYEFANKYENFKNSF